MEDLKTIKNLLVGVFILMSFSAVYFARDMFLPIVIGMLVALTLSPVVRSLARLGVPQGLSAVLLILGAAAIVGIGVYILSGPVAGFSKSRPAITVSPGHSFQ